MRRLFFIRGIYEWDEFRLFYSAMKPHSYLKVIKTTNAAKVRNEAIDIVDFLPGCGDGVIILSGGVYNLGIHFFFL